MTESAFMDALSVQLGFPFIDQSVEDVDPEVIENIPIKWRMSRVPENYSAAISSLVLPHRT